MTAPRTTNNSEYSTDLANCSMAVYFLASRWCSNVSMSCHSRCGTACIYHKGQQQHKWIILTQLSKSKLQQLHAIPYLFLACLSLQIALKQSIRFQSISVAINWTGITAHWARHGINKGVFYCVLSTLIKYDTEIVLFSGVNIFSFCLLGILLKL